MNDPSRTMLSIHDLDMIDGVLRAAGAPAQVKAVAAELRRRLPGLAILSCDAADVIEEPFRRYPVIDLHLVDHGGHCAAVTAEAGRANGLLLAARAALP